MNETNWVVDMFTSTLGDRTEGAKYMALNGVTMQHIDELPEEYIIEAHEAYMQEHADYGVDFTEDLEEFRVNLKHNLIVALGVSSMFK